MGGGYEGQPRPFRGGAAELMEMQLVDALCQRWGCAPSQVLAEPADYILRMLQAISTTDGAQPAADDDPLDTLAAMQQEID